jgi:AraC-like DNA-binding protein
MYEIYAPAAPLRPFIECFWFLRADITPPARLEEIVFSDARADLVFSFGAPYLRYRADNCAQAEHMTISNLDAQRRYPVHIVQQGQIHLVGVRFRPGGLSALLPLPVYELAGLTFSLRDSFEKDGAELEERLFEAADQRRFQLDLLNTFFLPRCAVSPEYTLVMHMASVIEQRRGAVTMTDLSRSYGYSIRTLDRLFQQVIGLPPKFYARTVRFRSILDYLAQHPDATWPDLAPTYGYYDQSHLTKEFISLTGLSPNQYLAQLQRRAHMSPPNHVQFLQDKPEHTR